jgi:serine/threonine protein kinase
MVAHPSHEALRSFGLGRLDQVSAAAVEKHLEQCLACQARVAGISADSLLRQVRAAVGAGISTFGRSIRRDEQSNARQNDSPEPATPALPACLADHADYEIKRELGSGGMGVVYLAHNKLMARDEVLKVIGLHIVGRPGVLDRFLREIRAVAMLRHPNIVTAYSAARLGESIVFAMEYVDGLDLARFVKARGPLPIVHACYFTYQAALGLQHAHEKGMVHRDIKPHNLMLTHDGDRRIVKILDFGLAKATREQKFDGSLTSEGQLLGTPDYIAPEQIVDASSADIRADIYSLGATLYHLLTGHVPFHANSLYDIYQAHISQNAQPLNIARPEVPVELAALVAKMMAKEPARRFQTPGEVAEGLTPFFKKPKLPLEVGQPESPPRDVNTPGSQCGARLVSAQPACEKITTVPSEVSPAAFGAKPTRTRLSELKDTERDSPVTDPAIELRHRRPRLLRPVVAAPAGCVAILLGIICNFTIQRNRINVDLRRDQLFAKQATDARSAPADRLGRPNQITAGNLGALRVQPAADDETWQAGQFNDLLDKVNPEKHAVAGMWKREGRDLVVEPSDVAHLVIPVEVRGSYDLQVQFTRTQGQCDVTVFLPVGLAAHQCLLLLSAWAGQVSALTFVDGKDSNDESNPSAVRPGVLQNDRRYTVDVQVRVRSDDVARIDVLLDGRPYMRWEGAAASLSVPEYYSVGNPSALGLGSHLGNVLFHEIKLRLLSGKRVVTGKATVLE